MKETKAVLWGLGAMGSGIYKLITERAGIKITGAIGRNPQKFGQDLGESAGMKPCGVKISGDAAAVLAAAEADIVLHATGSFFKEVHPELLQAVRAGCNVITIAEEMAEPWSADYALAADLDKAAKEKGVTVIGTGINPGFVLDALIIALTGVCFNIKKIEAERVNDLSPFGHTVMSTQGVGTTPDQFARGVEEGKIVGHIGFTQSISLIARALGWELDRIVEEKDPIISSTSRQTPVVKVEPGMVAGCYHRAYGYRNGEIAISLKHPQQIRPEAEGVETGDYIRIEGTPMVNLSIKPEIPGGIGTIAMAVNMIPLVLAGSPGLKTLVDLPAPASWSKLR
ncbi:MAG: NADP-binding protein [Dethiobacter sp.]|nr:NADP-binding protein [Dethiobacter sp.]